MKYKVFVVMALAWLLSACNFDSKLGGPLVEKIFGVPETPLTYCAAELNTLAPTAIVTSGFGMDINNTRNVASGIDSSNVGNLSLKFTVVDEGKEIRRGAPAATENVLYYAGVDKAYALDRETGCAYWYYQPPEQFGEIRSASVLLVDEPTLGKRLVIIGTRHAEVVALDALTGKPVWTQFAGNPGWLTINGINKNYSMITGGMQYHDGRVYVPIASYEVALAAVEPACCFSHGLLTVLDATDGSEVWTYHTTAKAEMQDGNPSKWGPSGAAIWSTPLIDEARNQVLVGTSQNFTKPQTDNSDAVVALDIATGAEKWVFKATLEDYYNASCAVDSPPFPNCPQPVYDYDVITPILADRGTPDPADDLIIAGDKSGTVYSLDPADGSHNWDTKIGAGGLLGGIHWAMAVDNNRVYAGVADFKVPKAVLLGSTLADLLDIYPSQVDGATPGVYALDLADGSIAWQRQDIQHSYNGAMYDSIFSAGVTLTNDVLFAGSLDGTLYAFNKNSGADLWQYYTGGATTDIMGRKGNGGAIDSVGAVIAGDEVILNSGYSVFNIGGKNQWQGGPGNAIFIFQLP